MRRGSPLARAPWQLREPKKPNLALLDPDLRRKLLIRAGGFDEVTGERLTTNPDVHHRKKKSQGRDDRPCNLLVVSRLTHNRLGQHEAWAREHGYVVSAYEDPADVALLLHLTRYVLLDNEFRYLDGETGQSVVA